MTFASPPTCIMQRPYPNHDNLFVVAGKGTDNTLYAAEGNEVATYDGSPPVNPNGTGASGAIAWTQIGLTTYSGDYGRPALASNSSQVALFYINNNRVYARYRALPYSSSSWAPMGGKQGPLLPYASGGVPGVVYLPGGTNKYVVFARTVGSDAVVRVYYVYFDGTNFESSWHGPIFIPYSVDSDLAAEHDPAYNALTIYFRSGSNIIQTSVPDASAIGAYPFYPVRAVEPSALVIGAPRVNYSGGLEQFRVVVVRGYTGTTPLVNRGILINDQGGTKTSPWPNEWD
jgi:hypothetical protein